MEKAFKKILVAFDGSKAAKSALNSAYGVSQKFQSEITALIVSGAKDMDTQAARGFLESFASEKGVDMAIEEKSGNVYEEILKLEKHGKFSLILQGSHGTSGWKNLWMGSNAFKVVSGSDCPVISVTEKASSPELNNIVLPLVDSVTTRQKVSYCIDMAHAFGATVHILGLSKSDGNETTKHVSSYVAQTQKFLEERGIATTTKEEYGVKVPEMCIAHAEAVNAGLLLMMTETESAGVFMDTYAQQLVNHSTVPVMTIHSRDTRVAGAAGY